MARSIFLLSLIFSSQLLSQTFEMDKIVVGSKRQMKTEDILTGVDTLEGFEGKTLNKVINEIRTLPGISITQSGAPGQQSAIFIRGGEARHVLVVVDGVRMNDPSNTEKFFNASLLNLSDVEKIEVLKGSQTLLYGSEAIAGVVNIITKKGSGRNWISATSGFSRGLSFDNTFFIRNGLFHINGYTEQSEGISAATKGDEKDGFENKGLTLNFFLELSELWTADWTYKSLNQFVETDGLDNNDMPVDAIGDYSKSRQQIFSQKLSYTGDDWNFSHLLGANRVDRHNKVSGTVYNFSGQEVSNELHWTKKTKTKNILLGLENDSESFEQSGIDSKFAGLTSAVFIADDYFDAWGVHYGLRSSYHTQFGEAFSPALGASRQVENYKIGLNYQRGFKSPTLYQLYGPDLGNFKVGNTELDPETSDYLELSMKGEGVEVSLFYNKIDAFIQYDANSGYINSSWIETTGAELSFLKSWGQHNFRPGIFLAKYNLSEGDKALRKPSEKATISYGYAVNPGQVFEADYLWRGASFDNVNGEIESLEAYGVLDIGFKIVDGKRASARIFIENVFDKTYETAYGYSNLPMTFGLELKKSY